MKSKIKLRVLIVFIVFIIGVLFSIIGIFIFKNKNKIEKNNEYQRYNIKDQIIKDNVSKNILGTLLNNKKLIENKIVFERNNANKTIDFFNIYLKKVFNINNNYETTTNIYKIYINDCNISFYVSWYFVNKELDLIYKNTKYYDYLNFCYIGK